MAAPTIVLKYNSGTEAVPVWTDILGGEVITFTGAGSSDGDLKPIQRPASGIYVADELWIDKATDAEITLYDGGGQGAAYAADIFTVNPTNTNIFAIQADTNPETQAGQLEAWDTTSYAATTKESLAGTTNLPHSFWRAAETGSNVTPASGAGTMPAGYTSQLDTTTTYQLEGSTNFITFTTALSAGNQNRFVLHIIIPDDATNPTEANRTVELTYHYFYT